MLRRAVDQHRAVLLRQRNRDVSFQIKMILSTDHHRGGQPPRRLTQARARIAAPHRVAGQYEALGRQRGADVEQCGQRLDDDLRPLRGFARCAHRGGRDREQRLPCILHQSIRKDGIVVDGAAVIVLAGDICGQGDRGDTGRFHHRREIQRRDSPVRDAAESKGGMQGVGRQRDVVAVLRPTADVQRRAVMNL